MAVDTSKADSSLRLLSLDGGGVRGIASLIILKHLMKALNPAGPPRKPCDYFDLIGGTSTGGIIAIMLGRLRMDVQTCIDSYIKLSSSVFLPRRSRANVLSKLKDKWELSGKYRAEALVEEMRRTIQNNAEERDPDAKLFDSNPSCKVFVCTFTKARNTPVLLRSYKTPDSVDSLSGSDCTIWQAARATSAAATFFDPIQIGRQIFVDGATGMNNPVEQVFEEALSIWPDAIQNSRIQCLVSIGTGIPDLKKFGDNLKQVAETLKKISTETEKTEERFYKTHEFLGLKNKYFRFNVDKGLTDVGIDDDDKIAEIECSAEEYLRNPRVTGLVGIFLAAVQRPVSLLERQVKDQQLTWLRTIDHLALHADARRNRTLNFEADHWFLNRTFEIWKDKAKSFMWLTGKPGSGKTILSSAVIDKLQKVSDVVVVFFYVSFRDEATQSLYNIKQSLLMQIIRHLVREDEGEKEHFYVPKVFQRLFEKYSHSQYPLDEDLDATLDELLNECGQVYIIIDALDEVIDQISVTVGGRSSIINFLAEICRNSHASIHVLVTSRREIDIETAVREVEVPTSIVLMDTAAVNADIKLFLIQSLRKHPFKQWPAKLKTKVAKTILSKANGVFRWAALQLLVLSDKDRERDVEIGLEELPKNLEETYELMLTRIQNSKRSAMALSVLKWLAYSQRPLLLSEISEIAVLEMQKHAFGTDDEYTVSFQPQNRFSSILMARRILGPLVAVAGIDDHDEIQQDQDGIMSFSHFTVKEYLQGRNVYPREFSLSEAASHRYIMQSCLGYIEYYDKWLIESCNPHGEQTAPSAHLRPTHEADTFDFDSDFEFSDSETTEAIQVDYRPFPLLLYAAKYWWQHALTFCTSHALMGIPGGVARIETAIDRLKGQAFGTSIKVMLARTEELSSKPTQVQGMGVLSSEIRQISPGIEYSTLVQATSLLAKFLSKHLSKTGSWKPQMAYDFDFESSLALHDASGIGEESIVQMLLDAGSYVNCRIYNEGTPLHRAVQKNHKRVVEQLVKGKAELDVTDVGRRTSLSWAAGEGFIDIATYLIENGANLDIRDVGEHYQYPIGRKEKEFAVLSNVYLGPTLPAKGWTALRWAIENHQEEVAIHLVEKGANIFAYDLWGACPFSVAIVSHKEAVVRAMIYTNREACKKAVFGRLWTPLHLASAYRSVPILKLFLAERADVQLSDRDSHTAMDIAAIGANALGRRIATLDGFSGMPPCDEVVKWNPLIGQCEDAIGLIIAFGGDLGPVGKFCRSPLFYASLFGQLEAAEVLLGCGASVHLKDRSGSTPLMLAASEGHNHVARLLLSKGAQVNATADNGMSALMWATVRAQVEMVRLLLEAGSDINLKREDSKTALMLASVIQPAAISRESKLETLRVILTKGPDTSLTMENGYTALMLASEEGDLMTVQLLLEAQADPSTKAKNGKTALDIAWDRGENTRKSQADRGEGMRIRGFLALRRDLRYSWRPIAKSSY